MAPKRKAPEGAQDDPKYARASVLDNGMIRTRPVGESQTSSASKGFPLPEPSVDDLYALNVLQLTRDRPLEGIAIQQTIGYLVDCLPAQVQRQIFVPPPGTLDIFDCEDDEFDDAADEEFRRDNSFWDSVRSAEYLFWPIEADSPGEFVTAVIHMRKGLIPDATFEANPRFPNRARPNVTAPDYTDVAAWSVVDAVRSPSAAQRVTRVKDRIRHIFGIEGIQFDEDSYMENEVEGWAFPWVPPQESTDRWSSGLRSFALMRQLFQRIVDFHCRQIGYQDTFFYEPTSGWLNVDQVRHEMIGICAINCIDDLEWKARLAVETIVAIEQVDGPKRRKVNETLRADKLKPSIGDKNAYVPESEATRIIDSEMDIDGGSEDGPEDNDEDDNGYLVNI